MSGKIDEISEKDLLDKLKDIGLSDKDSLVYLALLPRHDVGSSKIINATGLHGQFVYDSLERLEKMGLAKHVIQNGRKKFSANPPMRLVSIVEEKRLAAQSIAKQLQERYSGQHEQDFEVFQGESAFMAHQYDMLENVAEGSEVVAICGPTEKYLFTFGAEADAFEERRIEKRMSVRYIGMEPMRERLAEMRKWRKLWEYRILPGGMSTGLVDTDIWPDNITLNMFGDPILSFTITNKAMAEGYREFFEALWKLSKP
ncbi:MAG TPA: helix-turn-helix domain-containing protein [Candidatus Paceibacterota bacterium]|nr:helix-turn-helix domain-containing protein [Candidatus Paceibacterota bacterium]